MIQVDHCSILSLYYFRECSSLCVIFAVPEEHWYSADSDTEPDTLITSIPRLKTKSSTIGATVNTSSVSSELPPTKVALSSINGSGGGGGGFFHENGSRLDLG